MKINQSQILHNKQMYENRPNERLKSGCIHEGKEQNCDEINLNKPAERESLCGFERFKENNATPSFKGDPKLVTKIAKEALNGTEKMNIPSWANKFGGADAFKKVINKVKENETFYEAFVALVVAGILKPICVLAMPGAEKEDKEMAATKNFVSAMTGFALSNLILAPFSGGVNKIIKSLDGKNPTEYIKDAQYGKALVNEELLEGMKSTLGDSFKTTYKKMWDVGVSPLKAGVTLALMPYVLKTIFGDKKKKKGEKQNIDLNNFTALNAIRMQNNSKNVESLNQTSFKGNLKNKENNQPSFTGGISQVIDITEKAVKKNKTILGKAKDAYCNALAEPLAKAMGKMTEFKPMKKLVEAFAKFDKPSARWSDMASVAITYFYVNNTKKSEKIDEERKLPLMINNVMVTVASSTSAYLIDKYTDKPMENILRGYLKNRECEIYNKGNKDVVKTLDKALNKDIDIDDIARFTRHSDDLLKGGVENMSENLKESIKVLTNNETVQKAIKEKIINSDDVAKMAACAFEKQASDIFKNISKTKSLTIFTITVRFLVTVLMTPVIGRVVALVNKKLGKTPDKEQKQNTPPEFTRTLGMEDFMSGLK